MIASRLICAMGDPSRYAETVIEAECGNSKFSTKEKTVLKAGWKVFAIKSNTEKEE